MNKKLLTLSLLLTLGILLITGCGGTKDLTEGKSPQEIVVASSSAMQELKSYNFTMEMKMGVPNPEEGTIETIEMSSTGETTVNPVSAHFTMLTKVLGEEMPVELYVSVENDKIMEYMSNPLASGEWLKMELPMTADMQELTNPAKSLEMLQEMLVDAKVLKEVEENNVQYVVIEATLKPDSLAEFLPANNLVDMSQMSDLLANMGEIQYTTWIRKDNLYVTKTEMDLGDIMKRVIADQSWISEEEKAMLDQVTATLSMTYTDYNKVKKITIPEDIVKSAKDMNEFMSEE